MSTDHLKQALIELHATLETGGPLDPELVHLLKVLDHDIQTRVVHQVDVQSDRPPADTGDLSTRAQALSAKFAAQHPHLEPVLRELTDTLQRIGI